MRKWILLISFFIAGNAFAGNEEVSFRFEDGYNTAVLYLKGDQDSTAAKLYEKMEFVNAVDEGIGMSKAWKEQYFQWKCIAKTTGEFACNAKFYSAHPGTHFNINGGSLSFHGGPDFAQAFIRDESGFGIGSRPVNGSELSIRVYREQFELDVSE